MIPCLDGPHPIQNIEAAFDDLLDVYKRQIMAYMANGSLLDMSNLSELKSLLVDNGWTWLTAACTMLFSLMHWP